MGISAIIDWGGVRAGSAADDIGCWTAHGATDLIPAPAYTAAFLDGYRRQNDLTAADAAATDAGFPVSRISPALADAGKAAGTASTWISNTRTNVVFVP